MPFKDTHEGQTHYENDACGEPEHNKKLHNFLQQESEEFARELGELLHFVEGEIERDREEKSGAFRRDGGRMMNASIFLQRVKKSGNKRVLEGVIKILRRSVITNPLTGKKYDIGYNEGIEISISQLQAIIDGK